MTHVLALCGSLRAASTNLALLRAASRLAPAGVTVEIQEDLGSLTLFNPDLESAPPMGVLRLRDGIARSNALLIASPEYAHGVTGVIKNALDWLVSFEAFADKPVAIFNASPRSVHADASLREILITMSANLIVKACLALPLRGTGATADSIEASEHAPAIREALRSLGRAS
jgi:chromate reductase, NAD(P)H dehydrogenase (quinone)